MKMTQGYAGNEPGDPDKVAAVIFDLSRRDDLPEQLVLESDALAPIAQTDAVRSAAALRWSEVSRSTDFEEHIIPLRLLEQDRNRHMSFDAAFLSRMSFAWVTVWHILLLASNIGLASFIGMYSG